MSHAAISVDNVSLPKPKNVKYPWRDLEVGQSFYVEGRTHKYWTAAAATRERYHKGRDYSVRREGKGFRIFRLADKAEPPQPKKARKPD